MPQITLEYTDNIDNVGNVRQLLKQIHQAVHDVSGVTIGNCKSRARKLDCYYVGDQDEGHGFVAVDLLLLEGRDTELKQAIGNAVLALLEGHFSESMQRLQLQMTVNVHDIEKATYVKYPTGSFTKQ